MLHWLWKSSVHIRSHKLVETSSKTPPSCRLCVLMCLQQADSEGELCQADSLGSAGSSSTLASSVIEVEAERPEPGLTPQLRTNHEEEVFSSDVTTFSLHELARELLCFYDEALTGSLFTRLQLDSVSPPFYSPTEPRLKPESPPCLLLCSRSPATRWCWRETLFT